MNIKKTFVLLIVIGFTSFSCIQTAERKKQPVVKPMPKWYRSKIDQGIAIAKSIQEGEAHPTRVKERIDELGKEFRELKKGTAEQRASLIRLHSSLNEAWRNHYQTISPKDGDPHLVFATPQDWLPLT